MILIKYISVLDEFGSKEEAPSGESTLKTRSLPAWVRSKPRPLSTEDDLNDLYAKVSDTIYVSLGKMETINIHCFQDKNRESKTCLLCFECIFCAPRNTGRKFIE